MSTHAKHGATDSFYFVTFTCYKWLPLIKEADAYNRIYHLLNKAKQIGMLTMAYVVMPNHIHLLVYLKPDSKNLNTLIAGFKMLLAKYIVKRLVSRKKQGLLRKMQDGLTRGEKEREQKHKVFKLSFDAKLVDGDDEIDRVLEYIHSNPVTGKWSLANSPEEYKHSSCSQISTGKANGFRVSSFSSVEEIREAAIIRALSEHEEIHKNEKVQ